MWLVYAHVRTQMSQAWTTADSKVCHTLIYRSFKDERGFLTASQPSFSSSTRTLISSGMAMAGWVSFSWMATWTCGATDAVTAQSVSTGGGRGGFTRQQQQQVGELFFSELFGCVICFTLSGSLLKSVRAISLEPNLETLKRRMMSCRVADTTKYSCFRRSSFPSKNCG